MTDWLAFRGPDAQRLDSGTSHSGGLWHAMLRTNRGSEKKFSHADERGVVDYAADAPWMTATS